MIFKNNKCRLIVDIPIFQSYDYTGISKKCETAKALECNFLYAKRNILLIGLQKYL